MKIKRKIRLLVDLEVWDGMSNRGYLYLRKELKKKKFPFQLTAEIGDYDLEEDDVQSGRIEDLYLGEVKVIELIK